MKKLLAIALLTSSLYATAQVSSADDPITPEFRRFRFGLHFSPNISWIKPDTKFYEKGKSGLNFSYGINTEFSLAKNYAIATGLSIVGTKAAATYPGVYVQQVNDTVTLDLTSTVDATYKVKYINIPFALKMKTNEIGYMTYYGLFGFDLGVKYQAKGDLTYKKTGLSSEPTLTNEDISKKIGFFRAALLICGGFEYNLSGNTNIMVGFTFSNGFTNFYSKKQITYKTDPKGNVVLDAKAKPIEEGKAKAINNYIALNLGVFF